MRVAPDACPCLLATAHNIKDMYVEWWRLQTETRSAGPTGLRGAASSARPQDGGAVTGVPGAAVGHRADADGSASQAGRALQKDWQSLKSPHQPSLPPLQVFAGYGEPDRGKAGQQRAQCDFALGPGERGADTAVDAVAEGEM